MNGMHNSKNHSTDNSFPGCLGRMINLFDLNAGVATNRLLTNKPYRDVSPLSRRSQSDVSRMDQFVDQLEDKVMVSEFSRTCSNRKACGTPMKMLIAQEMSKEVNSEHNPPSVVAKLMGLDAFPQQQPDLVKQRSHSGGYSRSQSDTLLSYWQHDKGFWDLQMHHEFHQYPLHNQCKDIYEIMQQSPKTTCVREKPSPKGRCDETANDRKMALVRQKFMEAKRLSTDEKLRQTQQFQDALEILNSNKDLFLKLLQEPKSMFSQHLYNSNAAAPPPETKRITVLRPCKIVDNGKFSAKNNEKQIKKAAQVSKVMQSDKSNPGLSPTAVSWKFNENPAQPTRIVVLKPSPGKPHDTKAVVSPPSLSSGVLHGEEFIMGTEDDEARKSREVAKEVTRQMRETLSGLRRDGTLLSSVFSNGYIGDESSFYKSENEYAAGNLSDSEVMSPTSRHSLDYVNKYGSPFSSSSFSRASYSPESSVCREAKKRLSERWAMMAYNGNYQEQRPVRRSSSTLGEMLALSETKGTSRNGEGSWKEEESRGSMTKLVNDMHKDEVTDDSMRNLVRSKSVPESSTVFGIQLQCEASDEEQKKAEVPKETAKARRAKSSLKGKVSSLFFSRSKRSNKEKPVTSESQNESLPSRMPSDSPRRTENDRMKSLNDVGLEECSLPSLHQISGTSSDLAGAPCIASSEAGFFVSKHLISGNRSENQDQPSPVSVLETPFEEDENTATESSGNSKPEVGDLPVNCKSNLIDKSPPIGSISRTLSAGDPCVDTATSYPLKPSFSPQGTEDEDEEREWFSFVQALLSAAGLEGEVQSDTFLARWHSYENPLDPLLRDKYFNLNDMEDWSHEAKRRQKRSTGKLVFDGVNAALVDIAGYGYGYGSDACQRAMPCIGPHKTLLELEGTSFKMVDQVWARMKEWLSGEERWGVLVGDCGDSSSLVVEKVLRKEVVGKAWLNHLRLEMDNLGKEIERMLVEELVQEAVVELACCRA